MAGTFTGTNFLIILINLIPVPPLDGAQAWQLIPLLYRRWRKRRLTHRAAAIRQNIKLLRATDALKGPLPEELPETWMAW